jgi:hypothetical protein
LDGVPDNARIKVAVAPHQQTVEAIEELVEVGAHSGLVIQPIAKIYAQKYAAAYLAARTKNQEVAHKPKRQKSRYSSRCTDE